MTETIQSKNPVSYIECRGDELAPYIEGLAQLRLTVFHDWPYLYEGTLDFERQYLKTYTQSKNSFVTLAFVSNQIVGATTAILACDEEFSFQKPFLNQNINPNQVCYFGESILLSNFRGLGIGKEFMNRRLQFARSLPQVKWAAFCSVIRPESHPLKPTNYRPLDTFWRQMKFEPVQGMTTTYKWLDVGENSESEKALQFWMRTL